ncbi:MAG: LPS export ABC transporter permease LptF [Betaproteobacteria bacterium]|nr:LPS export ABC transporter permease LptF [Betaproteobacteria bacterium]
MSKRDEKSIFYRTLLNEFAASAVSSFVILLAITVIIQLVRLLGQAASGTLAPEGVVAFLGFRALNLLPVLLSLTLFIAVLQALTRSYRDSEMVVWFCSGVSLTAWVRPVIVFAMPLVLTIALLSLALSPWAVTKSEEFRRQLESRDEASTVAPGTFQESKQADRVYFVESAGGPKDKVANIFVQSAQNQKIGTMVAREGHQQTEANGDRFLVLLRGTRYEGLAGAPDYKVMNFERYAMRVETHEAKRDTPSTASLSTLELLRTPTPANLAQLGWRLGLPLSALILALLAIPLSFVNPRGGRSMNLVIAILVYMVYSNVLSVARVWVVQEKLNPLVGLWGFHAVMLVVFLLLLARRLSVFSLGRLRR